MSGPPRITLRDKYEKYVIRGPGCWGWGASFNRGGYGRLMAGGKRGAGLLAHRVAYELFIGPIPLGMCVLHRCDNPSCSRPDHLFLGNRKNNFYDALVKRRVRPRAPRKIIADQVIEIREWKGLHAAIAKATGISIASVSRIRAMKQSTDLGEHA